MSSYPVHSPVHGPVHSPESSFYTNPSLIDSHLLKFRPPCLSNESQWPKWKHSNWDVTSANYCVVLEYSQRSDEASLHHTGIDQIIDIEHYSDLSKLLWVSASILRFIHNCKHHTSIVRHTYPLQRTEIDQAAQVWICYVQQTSFPTEFLPPSWTLISIANLPYFWTANKLSAVVGWSMMLWLTKKPSSLAWETSINSPNCPLCTQSSPSCWSQCHSYCNSAEV